MLVVVLLLYCPLSPSPPLTPLSNMLFFILFYFSFTQKILEGNSTNPEAATDPEAENSKITAEWTRNVALAKLMAASRLKSNATDKEFAIVADLVAVGWNLGYLKALDNVSNAAQGFSTGEPLPPPFLTGDAVHLVPLVSQASPTLALAINQAPSHIASYVMVKCPKCHQLPCLLKDLKGDSVCGMTPKPRGHVCQQPLSKLSRTGRVQTRYMAAFISFLDALNQLVDEPDVWDMMEAGRDYDEIFKWADTPDGRVRKFLGNQIFDTNFYDMFSNACPFNGSPFFAKGNGNDFNFAVQLYADWAAMFNNQNNKVCISLGSPFSAFIAFYTTQTNTRTCIYTHT